MKAIVQYESGETESFAGYAGSDAEIVKEILDDHEPTKIWLLMDGADTSNFDLGTCPDWRLRTVWVTREDGSEAKVSLPSFKGDSLWSALWREYPVTYWQINSNNILPDDGRPSCDTEFDPDQDEALYDWLRTIRVEVAEYDPQGRRKVLKAIEGRDDAPDASAALADMAIDWATTHIENSGCDTSELDIKVEIGREAEWCWLEEGSE